MKRQAYIVPTFVLRPLPGIGGQQIRNRKTAASNRSFYRRIDPQKKSGGQNIRHAYKPLFFEPPCNFRENTSYFLPKIFVVSVYE